METFPAAEPEKEKWLAVADELEALQAPLNDGRGVATARLIAAHLRMGDLEGAQALCNTDGDKLLSDRYEGLFRDFIREKLFLPGQAPAGF